MIAYPSAYPGHPLGLLLLCSGALGFAPSSCSASLVPLLLFFFLCTRHAETLPLLRIHSLCSTHHYLHRDNVNGQGRAIANPTAVAGGSANVSIESCTTACFNAGFGIAGAEFAECVFLNFIFYRYTLYSTELNFVFFPFCTSLLYRIFLPRPSIIKFYLVWGYSECCK